MPSRPLSEGGTAFLAFIVLVALALAAGAVLVILADTPQAFVNDMQGLRALFPST